ncbi:MAG: DEAD/DEAH box helicase, partial [Clostridiales bacterium]|nr:DEAD/DEAH box helicase [Clostridiales bacterium]
MENKSFEQLELSSKVLRAIEDMGFEEPSKIQQDAIPTLLEGKDLIGQAQTGTGKTLAFGAPILSMERENKKGIDCLILT